MNYTYDDNLKPPIKIEMIKSFGTIDQLNGHIKSMTSAHIGQILSVKVERLSNSIDDLDFILIIKYFPCEGFSETPVYIKVVDVEDLGFIDGQLLRTSEQLVKAVDGDDILNGHFIGRYKIKDSYKYKYRFVLECRKK